MFALQIVAKLQKPGAGAPTREPIVDEKTQKASRVRVAVLILQLCDPQLKTGDDGVLLQEAGGSEEAGG